jgi:membrane protein
MMGWKRGLLKTGYLILKQSYLDFMIDNGPEWAASIAYYALLSIFPLLIATASVATYFVNRTWLFNQVFRVISQLLPSGTNAIETIVVQALEARGGLSVISLLLLIFSGMRIFGTLMKALNIAFNTGANYTFFRQTQIELIMLLSIGILFIVTFLFQITVGLLVGFVGQKDLQQTIVWLLGEIVTFLLLTLGFYLSYRYIPRSNVSWRSALIGAVLASVAFRVARPLFLGYVTQFANYNLVYGSLALLISLVVWTWIVGLIFVFCGEIAAHVQDLVIERKPVEVVKQRHMERSTKRTP